MTSEPSPPRATLRRHQRLRLKREFEHAYAEGVRVRSHDVIVYVLPNELDRSRGGVVASRRVGNAVRRNRAKRVLRAAWRRNRERLSQPCDVVIIAGPQWQELSLVAIEPDIQRLLDKADALLHR